MVSFKVWFSGIKINDLEGEKKHVKVQTYVIELAASREYCMLHPREF